MDILEIMRNRRSVRKYADRAIPDDALNRMKEALRLAPSACNYQPWKFIFVSNAQTKRKLVEACHGQSFIESAPFIVAGVGFPDSAYKKMGGDGNSVDVDVAIALDHLTLAAAAEGLGTCWIGSFNEKMVKTALGIPSAARVVALAPLGYPHDPSLIHPVEPNRRKPLDEVIVDERYG